MQQLKNLPIGIEDLESLIVDNYLYVDVSGERIGVIMIFCFRQQERQGE